MTEAIHFSSKAPTPSALNNKNKKRLLEEMCRIIIVEFERKSQVNSCLPLAMVLYSQCRKFGLEVDFVEGYGVTLHNYTFRHYWLEFDDTEYDLRRYVYRTLCPEYPPVINHKVLPQNCSVTTTEEDKMMEMFYKLVRATGNTQFYFDKAPDTLLKIKKAVEAKVEKFAKSLGNTE